MELKKRKKIVSLISFIVIVAIIIGLSIFLWPIMEDMVKDPQAFRAFIDEKGFAGMLIFVALIAAQIVFAVIPGEPFEIAAGYAFGAYAGLLLCMIGIAIGSLIVVFLTKKIGLPLVHSFFEPEQIEKLSKKASGKNFASFIFLAFFIPGTPKDILTYFAGLTDMKISTFLAIATIARIPSVISSTYAGAALGEKDYTKAIIAFVVVGVISLVGYLIYNGHSKKKAEKDGESRRF